MEIYSHYWKQSRALGCPSSYPPRLYAHEPNFPEEGYSPGNQAMIKNEVNNDDVYGFLDMSGVPGPSSGYSIPRTVRSPPARHATYSQGTAQRHTPNTDSMDHQDDDTIKEEGPITTGDSSSLFRPPSPRRDTASDAETEAYLRSTLNIPHHIPLDLYALPDETVTKPSISSLARLAIWGSPNKKLTLKQIYEAIERRYPSWKEEKDKPWQRSIRHNLSLKAIYRQVDRPASDPGKGNYWELDVKKGEINKRPRHRTGKDSSAGSHGSTSDPDSEDDSQSLSSSHAYRAPSSSYIPRPRILPISRSLPNSTYPSAIPFSVGQSFSEDTRTQFPGPFTMPSSPRPYNEMIRLQPNYLHGYQSQSVAQQNQNVMNPNTVMSDYSYNAHQDVPYPNFIGQGTMMDMGIPFPQDLGYPDRVMGSNPEMILYPSETPDLRPTNRRRRSDSFPGEDEQRRVRNFPPNRRNFG